MLSARKISNLKPDFVIFDPVKTIINSSSLSIKEKKETKSPAETQTITKEVSPSTASLENSELLDSFSSQKIARLSSTHDISNKQFKRFRIVKHKRKITKTSQVYTNKRKKKVKRYQLRKSKKANINTERKQRKKDSILVSIKSNMWGTNFKFFGHKYLPNLIGQIVYKTSLFHLQPRQMTITLEDLTYEHSRPINHSSINPKSTSILSCERKTTKLEKHVPTVLNRSFKSIDELSSYSTSSALLDLDDVSTNHKNLKDLKMLENQNRRSTTLSSVSSLIDPIESATMNGENEIDLTGKLYAARDIFEKQFDYQQELKNKNGIEFSERMNTEKQFDQTFAHKQHLPILSLADNKSADTYKNSFMEFELSHQLITSKTFSGSTESLIK